MILLAILDGWGYSKKRLGNAIKNAQTPNMDFYLKTYPSSILETSGEAVGLPNGQMGNSEVGHLNLGAGRIVYHDSTRILKAIEDKSFFCNSILKQTMTQAKKNRLHLMGLIGDGGVHAMDKHLFALLEMAHKEHVESVSIHCFLDGRDTPPKSALSFIRCLEKKNRGGRYWGHCKSCRTIFCDGSR